MHPPQDNTSQRLPAKTESKLGAGHLGVLPLGVSRNGLPFLLGGSKLPLIQEDKQLPGESGKLLYLGASISPPQWTASGDHKHFMTQTLLSSPSLSPYNRSRNEGQGGGLQTAAPSPDYVPNSLLSSLLNTPFQASMIRQTARSWRPLQLLFLLSSFKRPARM